MACAGEPASNPSLAAEAEASGGSSPDESSEGQEAGPVAGAARAATGAAAASQARNGSHVPSARMPAGAGAPQSAGPLVFYAPAGAEEPQWEGWEERARAPHTVNRRMTIYAHLHRKRVGRRALRYHWYFNM